MHGLILADVGRDWTLSGSVETFALPVGLFIVVAAILFFLYTRPHAVPGHRDLASASAGGARSAGGAQARAGGGGKANGGSTTARDSGAGS